MDFIVAAILLVFALTVIGLALQMPTFVATGGSAYTAPGIVPGFHGIVIALLSAVLAVRSVVRGAFRPGGGKPEGYEGLPGISLSRLFTAIGLCLLFSLVMVGTLPFWLATMIFVTAFITIFEWNSNAPKALRLRRFASGAVLGVGVGVAVYLVFQEIFLVRLP